MEANKDSRLVTVLDEDGSFKYYNYFSNSE